MITQHGKSNFDTAGKKKESISKDLTSYFPDITLRQPTSTVSIVLGCLRGGHSML